MNQLTLLLFTLLFFPSYLFSQQYELGFALGASNYQGDLSDPQFEIIESNLYLQGNFTYRYNSKYHFRSSLFYTKITGDDANDPRKKKRKFRFSNQLIELSVSGIWELQPRRSDYYVGIFKPHLSPYFHLGVGYMIGEAKTECYKESCLAGNDPFPEEKTMKGFPVLPYGAGLRYYIAEGLILGSEFSHRYTASDLLDGVSRRGKSGTNDWYFTLGFSINYRFGAKNLRDVNYF